MLSELYITLLTGLQYLPETNAPVWLADIQLLR